MAFEISEIPIISSRHLDDTKFSITINTETKDIKVEGVLVDEYSTGKITRQRIEDWFRDKPRGEAEYTNALNYLLPDDDAVVWTNPRKIIIAKIMELINERASREHG